MNLFSLIPPHLETFRLADDLLADAYEQTSPQHRAWIKHTLALVECLHPMPPTTSTRTDVYHSAGVCCQTRRTLAPWVILSLSDTYASPIRLASAIMVARMAGMESILAVWNAHSHIPHDLLTVLELTGVEISLKLASEATASLLEHLTKQGQGRILRFTQQAVPTPCDAYSIPTWSDDLPPRLRLADTADEALIRWAHPDAALLHDPDAALAVCHVCESQTPLCLEADFAGTWVHPQLAPDFFYNTSLTLRPLVDDEDAFTQASRTDSLLPTGMQGGSRS